MKKTFTTNSFWDERYQDKEYAYGQDPNDFLRNNASLFKEGDKVLSLAEGEGRNAVFIAQQACDVCGVDFSPKGQEKALQLAKKVGVSIQYDIADLTDYDMGEAQWDGIISIFCHPNETERVELFQKVRNALKLGGFFLFESYHKRQLDYGTGGPRDEDHLVTLEELQEMFEGFEVLHAKDVEREVNEGEYHSGLAYTTQFIARKHIG